MTTGGGLGWAGLGMTASWLGGKVTVGSADSTLRPAVVLANQGHMSRLTAAPPSHHACFPATRTPSVCSYFTIASFVTDHLDFHARYLLASGPRI